MKLLILGGPRCGKTTLAQNTFAALRDDGYTCLVWNIDEIVRNTEWSAVSDEVCRRLEQPGPWIIEGCAGVRGLRKYLKKHPGKPDFEIKYLGKPYVVRTPKQQSMATGIETVWKECQKILAERAKVLPPNADKDV